MSWRIATEHRSFYRYADPVVASYNEARITPTTSRGQLLVDSSVIIEPNTSLLTYLDYWSTIVTAFDVAEPHSELIVTGRSVVETPGPSIDVAELSWDDLRTDEVRDEFAELLLPTAYTEGDDHLRESAFEVVASGSPLEAVHAIGAWTRTMLDYVAGATEVSTSALQAYQQGAGVCQDFAHLALAMLRLAGIPARYVSGYLHPDSATVLGTPTPSQSHAWVEAWLGSWVAMDPTNGERVDERHITVARGRDYADVAPFRGVYHGGALERLDVEVTLTRLA